jgi:hypothetical protein
MRNKVISYKLLVLSLVGLLLLPGNWHVFAVDQMKTVEFYVGESDIALVGSTSINKDFTIYIGDNLAGVTNPVKSVFFEISGTFTKPGGGLLDVRIDNDAATLQSYTLPSTTNMVPFEILYKDPSNKINPTSSGSYNYQLNLTLGAGLTIYALGVKAFVTYRYAPTACDDGQPTAEKIKTTETYVGDSASSISGLTSFPFTLYIGDNLTGVTNPMKSAYFAVSGVYTGGAGTLGLQVDSGATSSFSLPVVTAPTPFEILYKDSSNAINPASAGSYNYTLNVTPASITVYGLGIKLLTTYRYKPPSCASLPANGDLKSAVFNTGAADGSAYNAISWKGTLVGSSKVRFQLATSNCANGKTNAPTCNDSGDWTYIGGVTCGSGDYYDATNADKTVETNCPGHNNNRYYRYKIQLCSSSDCITPGGDNPIVTDVTVNWSP